MRKKVAKTDFKISMLPKNRFQLFFDIYKNRLSLMLCVGLLTFLFCVPVIACALVTNLQISSIRQQMLSGALEEKEALLNMFHMRNSGNLVMIASAVFFSLGMSGITGVLRRLLFQEGVLFRADFFKSFKENSLSYAACGLALGVINYLLNYCVFSLSFSDSAWLQVAIGACLIAAVLLMSATPYILTQGTLYNMTFYAKLKNAFLLSMRMPHFTLAMLAVNVCPYLLLLIPNEICFIVFLIALPFAVLPIQILVNMLICDSVLDKFVNKQNYPQIYRKGMYSDADD